MADSAVASATQADDAVWKILVVDDEPAIHQVTKLALRNLSVLGRPCQLINALSAKDAREQLANHPDIAVILLDVVMETENAGLDFIKFVREKASNSLIRIILRTGQPGQAPERQVMLDYDINDYKEKTELTASKLFTSVMSSIRTFGHLQNMEKYQRAVEVLGSVNSQVFAASDTQALAQTLVSQVAALKLFNDIDCRLGQNSDTICTSGSPCGAQAQSAFMQRAQASPGTSVSESALHALSMSLANGQTLTFCMTAPRPLAPTSLRLLGLWVQSARLAVGRWAVAV